MEHILWVLIVTMISQGPQGEPVIQTQAIKSTFHERECWQWAEQEQAKVNGTPMIKIDCLAAKHGMVW